MTGWRKRTIMEMAREAAAIHGHTLKDVPEQATIEFITAFAKLVREDERELCAKLAQSTVCDTHIPTGVKIYGTAAAKAIRARGQA